MAQTLTIGAEDIHKLDFLRNVFVFGSILTMGKEEGYPRVSTRIFFMLILKYLITDFSRKSFSQHDMKAGTSTDLFQNNKICTASRSKIYNGDVHVLDLFPIFTPFLKYCVS